MAHVVEGKSNHPNNEASGPAQHDYSYLMDLVAGAIWEADPDTLQYTFVGKPAETLFGYPAEQWLLKPDLWEAHIHSEDRLRILTAVRNSVVEGNPLYADYRIIDPDGNAVWVRDIVNPTIENGKTTGLCGILTRIPQVAPRHDSLHEKEEQYRRIFEATSDGLVITDMDGYVVQINPAFSQLHGYTPEEMVGINARQFIHPDYHVRLDNFFGTVEAGEHIQVQSRNVRKDGTVFHVEVHGVPFLYNGKRHTLAVIRDITERVEAFELMEKRVASRTQELTTLLEVSANLASALELEPLLERILKQLRNVVEYSRATITIVDNPDISWDSAAIGDASVVHLSAWGDDRPDPLPVHTSVYIAEGTEVGDNMRLGIPTIVRDINEAEADFQELMRTTKRDNEPEVYEKIWQEERSMMFVPLAQGRHTIGAVVLRHPQPGFYNQRHARLAMGIAQQAAIAVENGRLMVHAHEKAALEERQRLARELHDSVTQSLFSINLIARSVEMMIQREGNHSADTLDKMVDLRQLTQGALAEMRALIFELRPGALEEEGLLQAIRKHAAAVEGRELLQVDVLADEANTPRLKPVIEEALYRIAQESLHNIVKHARASKVSIALNVAIDSHVLLRVSDDGIGFNRSDVPPGHMGLGTMTQRASALGGHCEIESAPGKGTTVEVKIPLTKAAILGSR